MDPKDARRREAAERDGEQQSVADGKPITGPFYPSHAKSVLDGETMEMTYMPDPRIAVAAQLFPTMYGLGHFGSDANTDDEILSIAVTRSVAVADQLVWAVAALPPLPVPPLFKSD